MAALVILVLLNNAGGNNYKKTLPATSMDPCDVAEAAKLIQCHVGKDENSACSDSWKAKEDGEGKTASKANPTLG